MKKPLLGFCFSLFICVFASAAEISKPNFIFILADDLGWTDLACFGSKVYETRMVDRKRVHN